MKADATTEAAVKRVLDKLAEAYAQRDMNGLLALFAPDTDVVLYGTGTDEKRVGRDAIKTQAERDWAQSESAAFSFDWTSLSAAGPVAWVAADSTFRVKAGGEEITLPAGRLSLVLERRGEDWLIMQMHFSFPAASQPEGQSWQA